MSDIGLDLTGVVGFLGLMAMTALFGMVAMVFCVMAFLGSHRHFGRAIASGLCAAITVPADVFLIDAVDRHLLTHGQLEAVDHWFWVWAIVLGLFWWQVDRMWVRQMHALK